MADPLWWLRNATKTYNPHWVKQGFSSPHQPFPDHAYLDYLFDFLKPRDQMQFEWNRRQVGEDPQFGAYQRVIKKSRTMMGTWACVGKFTHWAQTVPGSDFIFQSQTAEKAEELIDYAKTLYEQQDDWLKLHFPLDRRLGDFPKDMIRWQTGSRIIGIPSDPDKVRMFHPTGMFMDECRYIPDFDMNRMSALPAIGEILVMLSTAGSGQFAEFTQP